MTEDDLPLLHNLLKEVATEWFSIGLQLDIRYSELEKIRQNVMFALQGVDEYFLRMLARWLRFSKNRTVATLQQALIKSDFVVLADGLLQELNSSKKWRQ